MLADRLLVAVAVAVVVVVVVDKNAGNASFQKKMTPSPI